MLLRALAFAGFALVGGTALADVPLRRLIGSGDPLPGFGQPALDALRAHAAGRYTLFVADSDVDGQLVVGLYLLDGAKLTRVLDTTQGDALPGNPELELAISSWAVGDSGMVAICLNSYGLVAWRAGELRVPVRTGDVISAEPGLPVYSCGNPIVDENRIVFPLAFDEIVANPLFVWNWGDVEPTRFGLGGLQWVGGVGIGGDSSGVVARTGDLAPFGFWRREGGEGWEELLGFEEPFPGHPGATWFTGGAEVLGLTESGIVAPGTATNGAAGLYRVLGGQAETIAEVSAPDPTSGLLIVGTGEFFAAAGEHVVFQLQVDAATNLNDRIVLQGGDRDYRLVLAEGQELEGYPVEWLSLSWGALTHDRLVVDARRSNGDWALWEADLGPGPSALEIPAVGGWGLGTFAVVVACAALLGLRSRRRAVPPLPSP